MTKITQVQNNDSGLDARTKINQAIESVDTDSSIFGDGNTATPLSVGQPVGPTDSPVFNELTGKLNLQHAKTGASGTFGANESIIGCTASNITISLSSLANIQGRLLIIKDESGTASGASPITIDTQGAETIDGQSQVQIIVDYGFLAVYSDGSNWFII